MICYHLKAQYIDVLKKEKKLYTAPLLLFAVVLAHLRTLNHTLANLARATICTCVNSPRWPEAENKNIQNKTSCCQNMMKVQQNNMANAPTLNSKQAKKQ